MERSFMLNPPSTLAPPPATSLPLYAPLLPHPSHFPLHKPFGGASSAPSSSAQAQQQNPAAHHLPAHNLLPHPAPPVPYAFLHHPPIPPHNPLHSAEIPSAAVAALRSFKEADLGEAEQIPERRRASSVSMTTSPSSGDGEGEGGPRSSEESPPLTSDDHRGQKAGRSRPRGAGSKLVWQDDFPAENRFRKNKNMKRLYEFNEEVKAIIEDVLSNKRTADATSVNRCLSIVSEMSLLCESVRKHPVGGPASSAELKSTDEADIFSQVKRARQVGILRKQSHQDFGPKKRRVNKHKEVSQSPY